MKKTIIVLIFFILVPTYNYAENMADLETIIKQQESTFGINDFLKQCEKYAPDFINDLNVSNMFQDAVTGNIDNKGIFKSIFSKLGINLSEILKVFVNILIIVLIHSLLKSLTDGLENESVSKLVYYTQYILIVTVIMSSFSEILKSINNTIENITGFTGILIPILTSLMIFTGSITTSGALEPILLFIIELVAGTIKIFIIPVISLISVLVIVSKISDRVQIDKLSKFMKSSVVWILGIILTIFVGVISLEGSLTSAVDGITAKTAKAAVSTLIPVVRKNTGRRCR